MAFFRDWILKNWYLKLASLLIAFLLWSTYTSEPAAEVSYQVPIEFRNVPPQFEISGDVPSQVHLRIRGRSALLRRITPGDLGVSVDLSGSAEGENLVRLTFDKVEAPYGAQVVRISPSEIRLRLVRRELLRAPAR